MRISLLSDWLQYVEGEITKIGASERCFLHIAVTQPLVFLMRDTLTGMWSSFQSGDYLQKVQNKCHDGCENMNIVQVESQ